MFQFVRIVLCVLVFFSASYASAVQTSVWGYYSDHPHSPASTHPVGLSYKRGIDFGSGWDFIKPLDESGRVVRYSRKHRVLQLLRFSLNGSFVILQEATGVGAISDNSTLGANGYELMAVGTYGANCNKQLCPNVAMYNRASKRVDFWAVTDARIEAFTTTGVQGFEAEGIASGDWDKSRAGDELILYDKFKGRLRMFGVSSTFAEYIDFFGFTQRSAYVHTSWLREEGWGFNFEHLNALDTDNNGVNELWFFNSDTGAGKLVTVSNQYSIVGDVEDLDAWPRGSAFSVPAVIPASGALGRDEIAVYKFECDTSKHSCQAQAALGGVELDGTPYTRELRMWPWRLTHVVGIKVAPAHPPLMLLHSDRKQAKVLFVKLNGNDPTKQVDYDAAFVSEAMLRLNESFGPAGIGFVSDGILRDYPDPEMSEWCVAPKCEDGDTACEATRRECNALRSSTKARMRTYARYLSNSSCMACVEGADPYCRTTKFDGLCKGAFTGRCASECAGHQKPDQIVAYIHRSGQGFANSGERFLVLADMDRNMSTYTDSRGFVTDRHGHGSPGTSQPNDKDFKHVIHEFGHFFGLGHDHFRAHEETSTCARDVDGEHSYDPNKHFISSDSAPKPLMEAGSIGKCCAASDMSCTSGCWLAPDAVNYCTDTMLAVKNEDGEFLYVNSDRTQPMSYGGNCDRIYRFSPVQLMNMRFSRESASATQFTAKKRGYLFQ